MAALKTTLIAPVTALLAGLLFGVGLMISGMANPAKVLGFLDLTGRWDPSLAFVMAGAIAVGSLAFFAARRRDRSFLGLPMQLPVSTAITPRLVLGSAAFGIGWGLAGFCPGPALVALGAGYPKAVGFVAAMVAGMAVFELIERAKATTQRA
ncbi:YeeE/YedE family protein [Paraburkholderia terrae]|uniref:Membrane protein n=1 Tax=Paraburkholderia terrae TaxID=311230 RepID=A0ABM7U159_9BURK|nr:YeeE/YedE family protein [Paraburkholderia terrae]BCZ84655.1 membrane protein [Paraburkholderia terrae]BDC45901.1 membrane protein [Paraburkholderia terrae]